MDYELNKESRFRRYGRLIAKDWQLYVLLIPIIVFFILWRYKPMYGVLIAFKRYKVQEGINGSEFVGFYYFRELMFGASSMEFWRAFRNTFMINIYGILFGFPVPIILALFYSEIKNVVYRSSVQTLAYLPNFISEVIVTSLIIMLVSNSHGNIGIVTRIMQTFGLLGKDAKLLYDPQYFRAVYVISGIWTGAGYGSIVYFAAIMGIPPTNYEAARVDGASKFDQIRYVTLPGIASTLTIMLILRIGGMLSVGFEKVLLLYSPGVYQTADVISTYVSRVGLGLGATGAVNQSLGTAAEMFNSIVAMTLVLGANYIGKRVSETSLF